MINTTSFLQNMKQLEAAFGYDLPKARAEIYYKTLKARFNDEQFERATEQIILYCKRFPTIADFMEIENTNRPLL